MGKIMTNPGFWKVAAGLAVFCLSFNAPVYAQIGTLSEGACWYDSKDPLKIASFNDKTVYNGSRAQIEAEIETLLKQNKISEMELALHCGGYGASLVARVQTENGLFCVWTRFEKGKLVPRSIGVITEKSAEGRLCDGHKSGEFILAVHSRDYIAELQGPKWSSVIKEVHQVSGTIYRVVLMKEYEMKEAEVAAQLEETFVGKNFIRYIEFNEYHHPVGDYVLLK